MCERSIIEILQEPMHAIRNSEILDASNVSFCGGLKHLAPTSLRPNNTLHTPDIKSYSLRAGLGDLIVIWSNGTTRGVR